MLALAGNKNDLYEKEEVEESEGKKLAKEIGAIFQKTSAKESFGIEDLFIKIGLKFISPYNKDGNSTEKKRTTGTDPRCNRSTQTSSDLSDCLARYVRSQN